MLKIIAVLAMLNAAAPAFADLPTIFGQPLGKPIAYPECRLAKTGEPAILGYATDQTAVCFKHGNKPEEFLVEFPEQYAPDILGEATMGVITLGGNVEEIQLSTLGNWKHVLGILADKFGQEVFESDEQVLIDGESAPKQFRWKNPEYGVLYRTVDIDPRFGSLYIHTPKADAAVQQKLKNDAQNKVQF